MALTLAVDDVILFRERATGNCRGIGGGVFCPERGLTDQPGAERSSRCGASPRVSGFDDTIALKGQHILGSRRGNSRLVSPFQGLSLSEFSLPEGVAPGCYVAPRLGFDRCLLVHSNIVSSKRRCTRQSPSAPRFFLISVLLPRGLETPELRRENRGVDTIRSPGGDFQRPVPLRGSGPTAAGEAANWID